MRNQWIVFPRPNPRARARLICLPYAGGGVSAYRDWAGVLPPEIELGVVQLPGREARFGERLHTHASTILPALLEGMAPLKDRPLALFGHSMGALLAFELARTLERERRPPVVLFVSARRAPDILHQEPLHGLPDTALEQEIRRLNGTPAEVFAEPELLRLVLPILRADLTVDETYQVASRQPVQCPVVALGGRRDGAVPVGSLEAWTHWCSGPFRLALCDGDHFFIRAERDFVIRQVSQELNFRLSTLLT